MSDQEIAVQQSHSAPMLDITNETQMMMVDRFAGMMASGKATVPKHLADNKADCMAVTMQAMRWGMDPFIVAQKTHLVSGNLGYEAQLVNAVITSSTAIESRFFYEYSDGPWLVKNKQQVDANDWVRVGAILKGESDVQWGEKLYPSAVTTKNSPLWSQSGAGVKQQAAYLAVKYWSRLYTPHVILGVYTPDEVPLERELKEINPTKSALNIPSKEEVTDTCTGEVIQADTETGEVISAFDEIMHLMTESINIVQLKVASAKVNSPGYEFEKDSKEFNELLSFYKKKLSKLENEKDILNSDDQE